MRLWLIVRFILYAMLGSFTAKGDIAGVIAISTIIITTYLDERGE